MGHWDGLLRKCKNICHLKWSNTLTAMAILCQNSNMIKKLLMSIPFQWWSKLLKNLKRNGGPNSRRIQNNIIQVRYLRNTVSNLVSAQSAKRCTGSRMTNTQLAETLNVLVSICLLSLQMNKIKAHLSKIIPYLRKKVFLKVLLIILHKQIRLNTH